MVATESEINCHFSRLTNAKKIPFCDSLFHLCDSPHRNGLRAHLLHRLPRILFLPIYGFSLLIQRPLVAEPEVAIVSSPSFSTAIRLFNSLKVTLVLSKPRGRLNTKSLLCCSFTFGSFFSQHFGTEIWFQQISQNKYERKITQYNK